MATVFNKTIQPLDGNWILTINIASKDIADVNLAQEYGDINLSFANTQCVDPEDPTFSFTVVGSGLVYKNILLNKCEDATLIFVYYIEN